jgi:hypothetical protein
MAENRSIFYDEWRACLRAHYQYVVQIGDAVTEPTLRYVLMQAGLREDELTDLHAVFDGPLNVIALEEPSIDDNDAEAYVEDEILDDEHYDDGEYVDEAGDIDSANGDADVDDTQPPPAQLSLF